MPDTATKTKKRKKPATEGISHEAINAPKQPEPEPEPEPTQAEMNPYTGVKLMFYYPSDFPRDLKWEQQVETGMEVMQKWVLKTLGRTFRLQTPASVRSQSNWKHIHEVTVDDLSAWKFMTDDIIAQRMMVINDKNTLYYLVTQANDFCSGVFNGNAVISGSLARLAGGIKSDPPSAETREKDERNRVMWSMAPPESWRFEAVAWWAEEPIQAWRSMVHQIGHALERLEHGTLEDDPSIMLQWYDASAEWRSHEAEKLLTGDTGSRFMVLEEVPD